MTAAFIPIFKEKEKTHGEIEMWRAANAVISGLVIAASAIIGLAMIGISLALAVHHFSESTELMLRLLRVMFPYMLLVCIAAALMGMLNARGHFFIPAMGATMLNIVMIASVLWLAPHMGTRLPEQIFALAFGVLAAGVAQAAFQMPTLWREGFRYRWVSPWRNETVRLVVTRMIPGTIGVAAFQINVLLTQALAFWVEPAHRRIVQLCRAADGTAAGHVRHFAGDVFAADAVGAWRRKKIIPNSAPPCATASASLLFANLIAAILLVVLAEPIVRLLFERGDSSPPLQRRAPHSRWSVLRRDWSHFRRSISWRAPFSRWATPERR